MHTSLYLPDKEWQLLFAISEKMYPGKGVAHLITMGLHKHVYKEGGVDKICANNDPPGIIIKKNYNIPSSLESPLVCMSGSLKISKSSFIIRKIIDPLLNK